MPGTKAYCLSGFGQGLDMRPMNFQNAVPDFLVCSFCGVIPSTVMVLPCFHGVCEGCFAQCIGDNKTCPLDQTAIDDDEQMMLLLPKMLSLLKATCWNAPNGCSFSGSCTAVLDHFEKGCDFHAVSCSRCNQKVLRGDIVAHLKASCGDRVIQGTCSETSGRSALQSRQDESYREMRELLEQIRDDHLHLQTYSNQLSELVRAGSSSCKNGVANIVSLLGKMQTALLRGLEANIAESTRDVSSSLFYLRDRLTEASGKSSLNLIRLKAPQTLHWHITDLDKLMLEVSSYDSGGDRVLSGRSIGCYSISLALKITSYLTMEVFFRLDRSPFEKERLEWPFRSSVHAVLLHPQCIEKRISQHTSLCMGYPAYRVGHDSWRNGTKGTRVFSVDLSVVNKGGFVENDSIHFCVEAYPCY